MTKELIGNMLGVGRTTVALDARLQKMGAIRYRSGHITVLDRSILEGSAASVPTW